MINRTIAAVSTPYGRGGIAVIRISGADAIRVAEGFFSPVSGGVLGDCKSRRAIYGNIVDGSETVDDGIATLFRAPSSYTGEDTVEISCHGGILLTEKVLSLAFANGASPALPGEFTQRAFINGRIDLSKAEAVIGLIDAESERQLKLNASHANGVMKRCIDGYCREITHLISSVYVCIDYPDEDLEEVGNTEMLRRLSELRESMMSTLSTYREGRAVNEGIRTAIIGKPNAGKSSLLNRLLGEERAIVTPIAGTTRDTIEERLIIGRIMLTICDTAGIRDAADEVERLGVRRALEKAEGAELVLAVFDRSRPLDGEDEMLAGQLAEWLKDGKTVLAVVNKADSEPAFDVAELGERMFGEFADRVQMITVSADTGEGMEALRLSIEGLFVSGDIDYSSVAVISNARQYNAMRSAIDAVDRAITALKGGFGTDICGLDMEQALAYLGEIDGRSVTEAITDDIFHRFCVGK